MDIWGNIDHIRHVVETSKTKDEILQKLGLEYFGNYTKLEYFLKKYGYTNCNENGFFCK